MTRILLLMLLVWSSLAFDIKTNNKTLINEQPKLIASVPNGQRLLIGDINDPERNILHIANLKGTPY